MAKEKTTPEETPIVPFDPWKIMVKIKIPRERDAKEDVVISVNDRRFTIMRDVEVEVPRPVYDALMDHEYALDARDKFIEEHKINDD